MEILIQYVEDWIQSDVGKKEKAAPECAVVSIIDATLDLRMGKSLSFLSLF